jgi:hypothetical protein
MLVVSSGNRLPGSRIDRVPVDGGAARHYRWTQKRKIRFRVIASVRAELRTM